MSAFKDIVRSDISDVFINLDEFAAVHTVNGKKVPVIVDNNEMIERQKRMKSSMDGLYVKTTLIYVKAKDLGALPPVGSALTLDGKIFRVTDSMNEDGLYSIHLEANRS